MRLQPLDAAKQFVDEKFPRCFTALLAGSASRGEETDTSDLDIVVFDSTVQNAYRESFVLYGWRIESFIHNEISYLQQFEIDKQNGRATLAEMVSTGVILKDSEKTTTIKRNANRCLSAGPPPLSDDFINASRYFIYDLLDDFRDSKSDEEAIITVNTISIQLADFILRLNGQWSGRGKRLGRELYKFDEKLATKFFETLRHFYRHGDKQPFIDFVNSIYEPLGGQLFDGFKQVRK
ncbi:hypothetical protein [Alicyclobacillus acidiphilus]|uniref:hypothetical protein n=1 Tax=Alicyclobacillus acidiphilus TaxID=182455 RepID=UPI000836076C|nr:hypothetical protein [Alicyclobacillus acidiphilus]